MSSKSTASTGVSPVSNPEILESIEYPQYRTPKYFEYSQYIYAPKILPVLLCTPVAPRESNLLQRALVGPSVKVFCQKNGMKLPKRYGDDRSITHTPSILRIFGEF